MPRIVFLRREVYETEGHNKGPVFEEGEAVDCTQDFADRWVNRGAAELVSDSHKPAAGERFTRVEAAKRATAKPAAGKASKAAKETGPDTVSGASTETGPASETSLEGGAGNDSISGSSGADSLTGQ